MTALDEWINKNITMYPEGNVIVWTKVHNEIETFHHKSQPYGSARGKVRGQSREDLP